MMLNEPRMYRYSTMRLVALIILLLLLGTVPFVILGSFPFIYGLAVAVFIGFMIVLSILMMTRSTTVSDDAISTRNLFGESTLKWSEIESVSGSGTALKLHNRDGDVTVNPARNLTGYIDVIEIIGARRPDLFSPEKYNSFTRSWFKLLAFLIVSAGFLAASIYMYFNSDDMRMKTLFLGVVIFGILVFLFTSVLSIEIEGQQLTIRYLLSKMVLKAEDVQSILFSVVIGRTGRNYSLVIFTRKNRTIRFSDLGPSLPLTYLVLKNWQQGRR